MATPDKNILKSWHGEVLPVKTRNALVLLSGEQWLESGGWYLAGGTALALQAGHRVSVDLDFFTTEATFSEAELTEQLPKDAWVETFLKRGTVYGELKGAKVSFIAYPFFVPHKPFHQIGSVRMLDIDDIAVMKIVAISQRGRKRDFIDLYWCAHHRFPLIEIVKKLKAQYPSVAHNYHHILKSLTFFEDAENDPPARLVEDVPWSAVKTFFQQETIRVTKELLGLA
ncbi:MAG: nucleotidyl transferase AbiEii/AbiGii toxin family protein [Patescibacteria group bacterium]